MFQLATIYGFTLGSIGLLVLGTMPQVQERFKAYLTKSVLAANEELAGMFIDMSARKLQILFALAPVLGGFIGYGIFGGLIGLLGGLLLGFLIPHFALAFVRKNRVRKFRSQLVDSLLVLSSSLKAGLSLLQSLEVLAEESLPPMSQEIGLVTKETRMGLSLDESLKRLKRRVPVDELNLVVTSMLVARETGGDVTEVFSKLIETIRERIRIRERIKTLTVIPRVQGWLMASIPFIFGIFALKINPSYFNMLFKDPMGNIIGIGAVGLWLISLVLIFWFSRSPK